MTNPGPRDVSRSLAGLLCGTHSGVLRARRAHRIQPHTAARAHLILRPSPAPGIEELKLGGAQWRPDGRAADLARGLQEALDHELIIDLVLFGSMARGGTTGFSDVDAILILRDAAADDVRLLHRIRRRVLAAQRLVFAYQPLQHHGFECATPRLLQVAAETLALPSVTLRETRSLFGRAVYGGFEPGAGLATHDVLRRMVTGMIQIRAWPRNPRKLHRLISMYELLPTFYLQAHGESVPKWASFHRLRDHFGASWWPYDVLRDVRVEWPLVAPSWFDPLSTAVRNPWIAAEVWRRMPSTTPSRFNRLLGPDCLSALQRLARAMVE